MKTNHLFCALLLVPTLALADEDAIKAIQAIGSEGKGNAEAAAAFKKLSQSEVSALVGILKATKDANPLAANYLRSAVDVIVDRAGSEKLPLAELGEFLLDTRQNPRARTLAFELIQLADPDTVQKLVPGMLNDPSTDLRRDAVQQLIDEGTKVAESGNTDAASVILRQALNAARDVDQIETITKSIREHGGKVDLPQHYGFLMRWKVIGPFDNTDRKGFDTVFPPEKELDFDATYEGKKGEVKWSAFETPDDFGMVDINQPYGPLKEVTAYAYTEYESATTRPVELRLGCKNAWKVWLNGELLFGRDEYHRGMRIDQYTMPAQLKEGKNTILVKLCQNEQTERWTVEWQFQLRVCDATGTAVLASNRLPTPVKKATQRTRRPRRP